MKLNTKVFTYSFISLILVILLPFMMKLILHIGLGDVDTLSYVGAIIGGILTVIGIIVTINHSTNSINDSILRERKVRFIDSFPKKVESLDNLKNLLSDMIDEFEPIRDGELSQIIEYRDKYSSSLIKEAANIDGNVYQIIKAITDQIRKIRNLSSHGFFKEKEKLEDETDELFHKIQQADSSIFNYGLMLEERFSEITEEEQLLFDKSKTAS